MSDLGEAGELRAYGFDEAFEATFRALAGPAHRPGRVVVAHRGAVELVGSAGIVWGDLDGRFRRLDPLERPAVGDWVAWRPSAADPARGTVDLLVPRRSAFVRKAAGLEARPQVVAANVDVVFVVTSIDTDLNARRLERYLTIIREAGASPVILLSKADRPADRESALALASRSGGSAAVLPVSSETGEGLDAVREALRDSRTGALVGSSGVGKSTLLNRLVGEERFETAPTLRDDRGRHTTTRRELVLLPGGGCLVDTPGMRELGLWEAETGLAETFDDVARIGRSCRFRDCRHDDEPGCALRAAVESGEVSPERLASWRKLRAELDALERRRDPVALGEERRRWRAIHRSMRAHPKKR